MRPNGQSTSTRATGTRATGNRAIGSRDAVLWTIAGLFVTVTSAKLLIIGNLDLFYDEATYWQASLRLDAGYTHTLMMTPLLIRAGTFIFGDTLFGVRVIHLLCAAALPFAVYGLAHPMVGRRDAVLAAGVTLIMPVTALLGQAYMDPPMFLFTVLGLAAFERARRNDSLLAWLSLGAAVALGISTHYRFAPFVLGLLAYLLMTRQGRNLWKKSGLWIAGLVGALGLVPLVYFNVATGFAGFTYQVLERNPWAFQIKGLLFPLEQFLLVTPFLFIALMGTLAAAFKRARAGDDDCALLAVISAVYLGFYLVLAPYSDLKRVHMHWPAAGYLPLFVLLPGVLRAFAHGGTAAVTIKARRFCRWLVPASGAATVGVGIFFFGAWALPSTLVPDSLRHIVRHDLLNWSRMKGPVSRFVAEEFPGPPGNVALVASNYQVGSVLDFMMPPQDGVFVLDNHTNVRNGIARQLTLWSLDEGGLRRTRPGAPALLVLDNRDHWLDSRKDMAFRANLCSAFSALRYLGDFEFSGGRRHVHFYKGRVNPPGTAPPGKLRPGNCGALPSGYMAYPKRGARLKGTIDIRGWVLDEDAGIKRVEILLDGKAIGRAAYGNPVSDIGWLIPGSTDPNFPKVGYSFPWNTAMIGNGAHHVAIRAYSTDGKMRDFGRRTVFVDNP